MKNALLFVLSISFVLSSSAQLGDYKGTSAFKKYDVTYITPELKGKHGASLGFSAANFSPQSDLNPMFGGHLGYNYIILKSRKRVFGHKETTRDEVSMGFGAHLYVYSNKAWFFNFNYLNPTLALRGKLLSFYFFNEIGIGAHYSPPTLDEASSLKPNLSFEPLRLRFGKSPLNLCFKTYFDLGNSLLSKERLNITLNATLKYYFYRRK